MLKIFSTCKRNISYIFDKWRVIHYFHIKVHSETLYNDNMDVLLNSVRTQLSRR